MTNRIPLREWEALSAYLDGQLAQKERQRLEGRLQASLELRQALEDLRRTRAVLRSQPRLRAPRNFTLTPEMVGARAPSRPAMRLFPAFRFVSALASLLFILVLIGDLFSGAPAVPVASGPVAAQESAPMLESAAAAAEAVPKTSGEPEMGILASPVEGEDAETEETSGTEFPAEPPSAAMVAPTQAARFAEPPSEQGTAADLAQPGAGGFAENQEAPAISGALPERPSAPWLYPGLLRGAAIALGVLAVVTGLAAYLLRRLAQP